jgi:hypothetical protein
MSKCKRKKIARVKLAQMEAIIKARDLEEWGKAMKKKAKAERDAAAKRAKRAAAKQEKHGHEFSSATGSTCLVPGCDVHYEGVIDTRVYDDPDT